MTKTLPPATIADEVERYLRIGETDPHHAAWPGNGFMERANRANEDLRGALVREVRRHAEGLAHEPLPQADTVALTRDKVEPMVRGLFPRIEQDAVLATLEKSVVFLTTANIEALLLEHGYDSSAWTLANLYLASLGAELLGEDAPRLVGLSEETTCYVSPDYFAEDDPFAELQGQSRRGSSVPSASAPARRISLACGSWPATPRVCRPGSQGSRIARRAGADGRYSRRRQRACAR